MNRSIPAFHLENPSFTIRMAQAEDVSLCSRLEGDYETNYVWQMHFQERERSVQVTFNQVRLPRTMAVRYPFSSDEWAAILKNSPLLLVAAVDDAVVGCLACSIEASQSILSVDHIIVHQTIRRRKIGHHLLNAAQEVASQQGCKRLMMLMQTKNYPAIAFAQKSGFTQCGYNDKYYSNGDIALIFSLIL